jgi:putative membrane protein
MFYLIAKALHVLFVVFWVAGVAMTSWLMVKIAGQMEKKPEERDDTRMLVMTTSQLVRWIVWPSTILAILLATSIMHLHFQTVWFWIKLAFVLVLLGYQIFLQVVFSGMKKGEMPYTHGRLRVISEMGLLFISAIVVLAVLKSAIDRFILFAGIVGVVILLYLGVRMYLIRTGKKNQQ